MRSTIFTRRGLPAWGLLALGLGLSAFAARYTAQEAARDAHLRFAFACDQVVLKVRARFAAYELILRGGAGLFAARGEVDRGQWRAYVETLGADAVVPGVQGIGYARVIPAAELAAHLAAMRAEGFPDYTVRPAGERDVYTSIVYLEPFRDRNLRAFGFDMYSEPVRREAMARARDTGAATLSGHVRLVQETAERIQAGTLMYVPVYRSGTRHDDVAARRAALAGWSYSPFRVSDLMDGILREWEGAERRTIRMRIYDGPPGPDAQLFDSAADGARAARPALHEERRIELYGQQWLFSFDSASGAVEPSYAGAWGVAAGGGAVSVLIFALVLTLLGRQRAAYRIAEGLTADLRYQTQRLEESESRWRYALEGAGDGVWDWDVDAGTVYFSARWKQMLGYADEDIGAELEEWDERIHPDDRALTLAALDDYLAGRSDAYACEHRMRCKDGSYRWILDRGAVIERTADGRPRRMIGTHSDITARKRLEASLREREAELEEAQRIGRIGSWMLDFASGGITWSAELQRMLGPDAAPTELGQLHRLCDAETWSRLSAALDAMRTAGAPCELELEFSPPGGAAGWVLLRGEAIRDARGTLVGARGTAADISEAKRATQRIEYLTNLYVALSACNAAIVHCTSDAQLYARICEVVVKQGRMALAWIGLADAASGTVVPVASHGEGAEYLQGIRVSTDAADAHGRGPTGTATREGVPVWVDDFAADPRTQPWRERGANFGWRASAALPIRRNGRCIGALTLYARHSGWFVPETRALLQEMAADISFALDKLDAETEAEARAAKLLESEQRYRGLVEQTIAGVLIVQDGRIAYANPRAAQILGAEGVAGLLGRGAAEFVRARDRDAIAGLLDDPEPGRHGRTEFLFSAVRRDGTEVEVAVDFATTTYESRPAVIALMQDMSDRRVAEQQIRRYARQLEETFLQTVALATNLSEMRDPYTAGHERRVAGIAVAIGRELGLDADRLEGLRVGGYLHDVGKITVPSEVLSKPGRLTPLEYALIQQHAQAGYDVLKEVSFPWPVAQIALQHHERWDGSGYPQGLRGEEIILEARITAVADVVESMASHRPYRSGLGVPAALAEIERGLGTAYDADVAAACLRLFRERGYAIPG